MPIKAAIWLTTQLGKMGPQKLSGHHCDDPRFLLERTTHYIIGDCATQSSQWETGDHSDKERMQKSPSAPTSTCLWADSPLPTALDEAACNPHRIHRCYQPRKGKETEGGNKQTKGISEPPKSGLPSVPLSFCLEKDQSINQLPPPLIFLQVPT